MKHIDFKRDTFVRNMLLVDPRTGDGGYALVKCSIEDAIACELVTEQEVDAARQEQERKIMAIHHSVQYVKLSGVIEVLQVHGIDYHFEGDDKVDKAEYDAWLSHEM